MGRAKGLRSPLLMALTWCLTAGAASAAAPPLSGFWKMDEAKPAAPVLTKWAKAKAAASKGKVKGDLNIDAAKWCVQHGMPRTMNSAGPLDIILGKREVTIMVEDLGFPRHIYLDRKSHPDPNIYDDSDTGNALGHWDKGDLVVESNGFSDGIGPFGSVRTTKTRLLERFHLQGDVLKVTSTWSDPKVFAKPYTYTLTYRRLPADYTPVESYCDPRDNGVGRS